jgi:hypothetical protein
MGALADASAKLQEVASEISAIDMTEEKADAQAFLSSLSNAVAVLSAAFQSLISVVQSAGGDEEPAAE